MKLKGRIIRNSSGLDSISFWLQGHRFVKLCLLMSFISSFLVIEYTTSEIKAFSWFSVQNFISLAIESFILGNRFCLFCQWKLKKKGPLKFLWTLYLYQYPITISTDWCEKRRKSFYAFVFTGSSLYLVSYCHLPSRYLMLALANILCSLKAQKGVDENEDEWPWSTRQKKALLGLRDFLWMEEHRKDWLFGYGSVLFGSNIFLSFLLLSCCASITRHKLLFIESWILSLVLSTISLICSF